MPPKKPLKRTYTPRKPKQETVPTPRPPLPPRSPLPPRLPRRQPLPLLPPPLQRLPPLPPPPPLEPLRPLAPAQDDIVQQLPDEDLFDNLSPLDFTPSYPLSPEPLSTILPSIPSRPLPSTILPSIPSCPLPSSPPKDWPSSSWLDVYDRQQEQEQEQSSLDKLVDDSKPATPSPTFSSPTSEDGFTIRRRKRKPPNLIVPQPEYDYDLGLINVDNVDTYYAEETFQHDSETTSPSAKLMGAGIKNIGNICFMSVILQCFTHTVPLLQGLRSCTHITPCGADGFCVICALREHNDASLASSGESIFPRRLADNLSNFSPNFKRCQQEDAHEFMQCALNYLGRCFSEGEENLVQKVFGGRLVSKLRCCNCGHCSDTYEPLIDISLEIENVNSLQHALESFTMVEKIDEKLTCASCRENVSMEKQLMLYQTPTIAAFHLKRFKKDGPTVEKIDRRVYFTMELDLQPYTSGNRNDNVLLQYDLYAVVVHVGSTPNSGHYFCFVRSSPDQWHKFNDSQVTSANGDLVLCQVAYMLFYARQGTPWFSSIMGSQKSDNVEKDEQKLHCSGGENDDDPMDGGKPDPKAVSDNVEKDEQMADSSGRESDDDPMDAYNDSVDASGEETNAHTQGAP